MTRFRLGYGSVVGVSLLTLAGIAAALALTYGAAGRGAGR
jgi:hypothetical protein